MAGCQCCTYFELLYLPRGRASFVSVLRVPTETTPAPVLLFLFFVLCVNCVDSVRSLSCSLALAPLISQLLCTTSSYFFIFPARRRLLTDWCCGGGGGRVGGWSCDRPAVLWVWFRFSVPLDEYVHSLGVRDDGMGGRPQ